MNLNAEQKQAVDHFKGVCVVTAVPGSGKTSTLTARVMDLVQKKDVDPSNILCLTFTNKAANEMRERIAEQAGQVAEKVWVSTFHALCIAILRKYGSRVGIESNFSIYTEKDQKELMDKVVRMHGYEPTYRKKTINHYCKVANDFREDIADFDTHIQELAHPGPAVIKEYLELLDKWNAVDFTGILYKTWLLFKRHPKATRILNNKFQFVLVDEMQDTNTIQYELVHSIVDPEKKRDGNLFVVGDFNQSIFSWRGAKPENIQRVSHDFDKVSEIVLPRNYRSTSHILQSAQNLIRHNDNARDVHLVSERGDGQPVSFKRHFDVESEANYIAAAIQGMKAKNGYSLNDFAVLYRTNALSKQPEIALRKYDIPYKIVGGFSFFDRREIKDALAYLSFVANPSDSIQFARAISSPRRSLGSTAIGRIERYCQDNNISILEACQSPDVKLTSKMRENLNEFVGVIQKAQHAQASHEGLSSVVSNLLKNSGYYEYVENEDAKEYKTSKRIDNLDEFLASVADYEEKKPTATIRDFLHTVQILTSDLADSEDDDAVTLLTMHSAKGLQFPVVFIVGVEKEIIPHQMALAERGEKEERRLMYVAMTRAKSVLTISYCLNRRKYSFGEKRNRTMVCEPSIFIKEILEEMPDVQKSEILNTGCS